MSSKTQKNPRFETQNTAVTPRFRCQSTPTRKTAIRFFVSSIIQRFLSGKKQRRPAWSQYAKTRQKQTRFREKPRIIAWQPRWTGFCLKSEAIPLFLESPLIPLLPATKPSVFPTKSTNQDFFKGL